MNIDVRLAEDQDLGDLVRMFEAYLNFYSVIRSASEIQNFIRERMHYQDSVIFIAYGCATDAKVGFAQLYPTFSSLSLKRQFILNDL